MTARNTVKAVALASALILTLLTSCKGRTMENMEPTGETVEVIVNAPDTVAEQPIENL